MAADTRIGIITMWYNEARLAPLFLRHYSWVDRIHLLLDADTTDETEAIAKQFANVVIEPFRFPDGMDDLLKIAKYNETITKMQNCDWVIGLDADEFIWPDTWEPDARFFLSRQSCDVMVASMWQVYRHRTERAIDYTAPAMWQRRHGDPQRTSNANRFYNKPCIINPCLGITWTPGCHEFRCDIPVNVGRNGFLGTHWAMADVDLAIERRIAGRRDRMSQVNLSRGLTVQHHHITEDEIRASCEAHLDDPRLF